MPRRPAVGGRAADKAVVGPLPGAPEYGRTHPTIPSGAAGGTAISVGTAEKCRGRVVQKRPRRGRPRRPLVLAPTGRQGITRGASPWTAGHNQREAPTGRRNTATAPPAVAPSGLHSACHSGP